MILCQLLFQYLARLAALGHGINVYLCKGVACSSVRVLSKSLCFVLEHQLQELVLYVLPPQWYTILLLKMLDLIAGID